MIKIVKAEERHIPDICKLWLDFIRYTDNIDPILEVRDESVPFLEREKDLRLAIKSETSLVLVALEDNIAVGYSYLKIQEPFVFEKRKKFGYIHDLFITKDYRRRGIGGKMFTEILKWFHSQGIDRVELGILTRNQAASSFWKKHGFTDYRRTLYKQI